MLKELKAASVMRVIFECLMRYRIEHLAEFLIRKEGQCCKEQMTLSPI